MVVPPPRSITFRFLRRRVRVTGILYGLVLAASFGFGLAYFHGRPLVDIGTNVVALLSADDEEGTDERELAGEANGRKANTGHPLGLPKAPRASLRASTALVPTYQADPKKLGDRVLPLRVAPDPNSAVKLNIPAGTAGIVATGATAYHDEWSSDSSHRRALWREVKVGGHTGWVSAYYLVDVPR
jgi:hypothetical protein